MANYIDAIVIPVPRANLDTYKRMSTEWGNAHLRHGALYYSDSISDDAQPGNVTSFPQAVQLKDRAVARRDWVPSRRQDRSDAHPARVWAGRGQSSHLDWLGLGNALECLRCQSRHARQRDLLRPATQ